MQVEAATPSEESLWDTYGWLVTLLGGWGLGAVTFVALPPTIAGFWRLGTAVGILCVVVFAGGVIDERRA